MRKNLWIWALGGLALGTLSGMLLGGWQHGQTAKPRLTRRVARRLPISKSLHTIPDERGNYDLDGVSFDTEGVIVSGDTSKSQLSL